MRENEEILHNRTENKQTKNEGEESAPTLNILALSHVLHGLSTSPSSIKKESIFYFLFVKTKLEKQIK